MNLIEILLLVQEMPRDEARDRMKEIGVHKAVRKAVLDCKRADGRYVVADENNTFRQTKVVYLGTVSV